MGTKRPVTDMPEVVRDPNWRERESTLFLDGKYKTPVWNDEEFWYARSNVHREHFVHVSPDDRGMLIYTQTTEKGERGIYTTIKAGRYLTKYFGDYLNEAQIKLYAMWQTEGEIPSEFKDPAIWELKFATTPDEIVDVYMRGPNSCMDGRHFQQDNAPVRVYGAGDLAVAYLNNDNAPNQKFVRARALVWPDKKVCGRIYPTPGEWRHDGFANQAEAMGCYQALAQRLRAEGYKIAGEDKGVRKLFDGARILKQLYGESKYSFVMPYMDLSYGVKDAGDHFVMAYDTSRSSCETCGYIEFEPEWDWLCDNCRDGAMNEDATPTAVFVGYRRGEGTRPQHWCANCRQAYTFTCAGSGMEFGTATGVWIGDKQYASGWVLENGGYRSEYSGSFYFQADDPRTTHMGCIMSTSEHTERLGFEQEQARLVQAERERELVPRRRRSTRNPPQPAAPEPAPAHDDTFAGLVRRPTELPRDLTLAGFDPNTSYTFRVTEAAPEARLAEQVQRQFYQHITTPVGPAPIPAERDLALRALALSNPLPNHSLNPSWTVGPIDFRVAVNEIERVIGEIIPELETEEVGGNDWHRNLRLYGSRTASARAAGYADILSARWQQARAQIPQPLPSSSGRR